MFNILVSRLTKNRCRRASALKPFNRSAPKFEDQSTKAEMLETGIKVVDLLCPYQKGGKIGLFGGAGVGKNRTDSGADP